MGMPDEVDHPNLGRRVSITEPRQYGQDGKTIPIPNTIGKNEFA